MYPQLFAGGGRFDDSIPDTTITGYASFNGAARALISPTTDIQLSDNLTWIRGAHTLKFGGMVVRNRKDQNGRSLYAGRLDFNPTGNMNSTGHSFADALLGNFRSYSEFAYDPMGFFRFWQAEGFVSDNWRRHIVVGTWTWQIPLFRRDSGLGRVLGGWEISGIGRYQSGAPLTVTGNTTIGTRRADLVGDPFLPESERIPLPSGAVPYLNPPAFAPPPEGRAGNSIRGGFKGPSLTVFDVSLRKQFAVKGGVGLQVQADFFNVLNQTQLRFSGQSLNRSGGGSASSTRRRRLGRSSSACG